MYAVLSDMSLFCFLSSVTRLSLCKSGEKRASRLCIFLRTRGTQIPSTKLRPPEQANTIEQRSRSASGEDRTYSGSQKDTQTPRHMNISTPFVADVSSNNSNKIESSTSTLLAHIAVCAHIRLLSSGGQCASAAPHGKLPCGAALAHWRARGPRRAPV